MVDAVLEWASLISATVGCMVTLALVVIEISSANKEV